MFSVITDHPIAIDSRDHTHPGGTMHDNSRWPRFNEKLFNLYNKQLRVMDMGCAGGGFVKDCLDAGHIAIGLEGSDYSLHWDGPGGTDEERARRKPGKRAEWGTIPDNLFTCDITYPFEVKENGKAAKFDVITAWEVMEHLPADRLPTLCNNVKNHLAPKGLWIMSVSRQPGEHHVTVENPEWWHNLFAANSFFNHDELVRYFDNDWIRGPLQNGGWSFHLILEAV